jgi:hypothetical protein
MARPGEDHRHVAIVGGCYDFVVAGQAAARVRAGIGSGEKPYQGDG